MEHQNHKQKNCCKQTKRNSFELAESHRLLVVNEEKMKSRETEKTQIEMPSIVRRRPIKITGKDIDRNKSEFNNIAKRFHMEGEPMLVDQTQINLAKRHLTSKAINHRTSPSDTAHHRKTPSNTIKPRQTQYIPVKPRVRNVSVLTDRPPGTPLYNAQDQDVVNTVGPVPMTYGHGPNTFPYSAAQVLNINNELSDPKGVTINEIYTSAAH